MKMNFKNISKTAFWWIIYAFAALGFIFVTVYFAVKFKLTNTSGVIDTQNDFFQQQAVTTSVDKLDLSSSCTLQHGINYARNDVVAVFSAYGSTKDIGLVNKMSSTLYLELAKNAEFKAKYDACFAENKSQSIQNLQNNLYLNSPTTIYPWAQGDEWLALQTALTKDAPVIKKAAQDAGVQPRLIVSALIVEQLRLFYSDRQLFKQVFSPLKILGNQSQFSWGVMGIKPETAVVIENNLKDSTSPYYLGPIFQNTLNFKTGNIDSERFTRIVDEHNHYYSYLYAGLYFREFVAQWQKAGFDISNRPEILATLYNIGFNGSHPSATPAVGGAEIKIGDLSYSFGSLANEFYYSGLLTDLFPY